MKKAFDSIDHSFLISFVKKFGFGKEFMTWIEISLKDQELCVRNCGTATQYFNLERSTRQGDPVSVHLFMLVLKILIIIKKYLKVKRVEIFALLAYFLYTEYADDTFLFFCFF